MVLAPGNCEKLETLSAEQGGKYSNPWACEKEASQERASKSPICSQNCADLSKISPIINLWDLEHRLKILEDQRNVFGWISSSS